MSWTTFIRRRTRGLSGDSASSSEEECPDAVTADAAVTPDSSSPLIITSEPVINGQLSADVAADSSLVKSATDVTTAVYQGSGPCNEAVSSITQEMNGQDVCLHAKSVSAEYKPCDTSATLAGTTA